MKYQWRLDESVGCRENPGYTVEGMKLHRVEVCPRWPGVQRVTVNGVSRYYRRGSVTAPTIQALRKIK